MTMTVICEECGKVYHIPRSRLDKVEGHTAKTKCKNCGHLIEIKKPETAEEHTGDNLYNDIATSSAEDTVQAASEPDKKTSTPYKNKGFGISGLGIRGNMIILFMLIPLVLIAMLGFFSQMQLNTLSRLISGAGKKLVTDLSEDQIAVMARLTAKHCKLYLKQNPGLTKERFNTDSSFREIALQKVGQTGHTRIMEVPDIKTGAYISWVDPLQQRIGKDITPGINRLTEKQAAAIWKIYHTAVGKNEAKGYYPWADKKGRLRDKFMYLQRIQDTPYFLVALTFIDEFTQPMLQIETQAQIITAKTRNVGLGILGATILVIGLLVAFYGRRLSSSINHLAEVADRISIGELDAEVGITSTDEIGRLSEAISRMQDSLNLSIQRLRRRR